MSSKRQIQIRPIFLNFPGLFADNSNRAGTTVKNPGHYDKFLRFTSDQTATSPAFSISRQNFRLAAQTATRRFDLT